MKHKPGRKNIRLMEYDYSQPGYYFITICAKDKQNIFGEITDCRGGALPRPNSSNEIPLQPNCRGGALPRPIVRLSSIGEILLMQWQELKNRYQNIVPEQMIIMPNHIHGILIINSWEGQSPSPTLGNVIGAYKSITTKLANKEGKLSGRSIWQRNYYDHIIRNEKELSQMRKYIEDNPLKWREDEYYV